MNRDERSARRILANYVRKVIPLESKLGWNFWKACTTGKEKHFFEVEQLSNELDLSFRDWRTRRRLEEILQNDEIDDPQLIRAVEMLNGTYSQLDVPLSLLRDVSRKERALSSEMINYDFFFEGRAVSEDFLRNTLAKSDDCKKVKTSWESFMRRGEDLSGLLLELVRSRNKVARAEGYENFYSYSISYQEMDFDWLSDILKNIELRVSDSFMEAKSEIDFSLKKKFGVPELDIWHYSNPFFQDYPELGGVSLDRIYEGRDFKFLASEFFKGIGLPIRKVLSRSNLYPGKDKATSAFCMSLDSDGDVRILANLANNRDSLVTLFHECGHAVYDVAIANSDIDYIFKAPAHTFITEGIALMFESVPLSGDWLKRTLGVGGRSLRSYLKLADITKRRYVQIYSRFIQVMAEFENGMYECPEQDLNSLWWDLVEKYQGVRRPEGRDAPDYATKAHLCDSPVYFHNYLLGEIFAAQLENYIKKNITCGGSLVDNKNVGEFLIEEIFRHGSSKSWDEIVKDSTGEPLNLKYFAKKYL